jgi:Zn-dependent alcohol dehydrogenase
VTSLQPGDHVIPAWVGDCGKCFHCKQGKSNCCDVLLHNFDSGVMISDKKTRFTTLDGKPIYHFFGISTFSQYSVMDEASCAKVNPKAPLDKICLLGCGVATGERNLHFSLS